MSKEYPLKNINDQFDLPLLANDTDLDALISKLGGNRQNPKLSKI